MGVIVFNGVSSKDVGIEVETFPTYDVPKREYEAIHVPGRNGDIIIDNGTYENIARTYSVSIATYDTRYHQKMASVARWLYSTTGYARLEDSYEPDFYRYAYYNEIVSFENLFNEAGRANLNFMCKPQRFYKTGDIPVEFTAAGDIQNATVNIALPKMEVTTDNTQGTITINGVTITISANSGTSLIIDSELQDAYTSQNVNKNMSIILNDGVFPVLDPGKNTISFTGGVQSLKITPRWWAL